MRKPTVERIVEYIKTCGQASPKEIGDFLKTIGMRAVRKQLKKMLDQGILKRAGKPPNVTYFMLGSEESRVIIEKMKPVLKKHGVLKADLFGSTARGDMKIDSDVDILVKMPDRTSLFGVGRLKVDLEKALSKNVDVVEYDAVHPYLKNSIYSSMMSVSL